ncbi:hypothetical protein [Arsenicicoccus dermatophilus]|uniref:hypothetical protein n=1 Tax=Arsenicicoccus dermatophilus TaxID=1076331 RepID=UPI001F4D2277|nr:hypothetical protein [Arsenicicoccus dermatophilus]MCH8613451.1 hypothetical protein [Arsenicicoccus dermatophilus]
MTVIVCDQPGCPWRLEPSTPVDVDAILTEVAAHQRTHQTQTTPERPVKVGRKTWKDQP